MEQGSTKTDANSMALFAGEAWFAPAANASRFGEIPICTTTAWCKSLSSKAVATTGSPKT